MGPRVDGGKSMITVLGLDPGSQIAGFAVVKEARGRFHRIDSGSLVLPKKASYSERLMVLHQHLDRIFKAHQPDVVVVEKAFFGKNADSAFKLGQVRGVCILLAAQYGAELHEYAAKRIKKVITGSGAATKEHVQMVVANLVGHKVSGPFDESDAIAIALCHLNEMSIRQKIDTQTGGIL